MDNEIKKILDGMKDEERDHVKPGDYKDDEGYWVCHVCGKRIQAAVYNPIYRQYVFGAWCPCGCDRKRESDYETAMRRELLRETCFPHAGMGKVTLENDGGYHPELSKAVRRYVEGFPEMKKNGQGLLFYGQPGTGKTHLGLMCLNALIDKLYSAKFVLLESAWRESMRLNGRTDFIDTICSKSVVMLDDLGAERDNPQMRSFVFETVNALYQAKVPFIVTTNMSVSDLMKPKDAKSERVYHRILERCPSPIEVACSGLNVRGQIIRRDMKGYGERIWGN